MFYIIIGLLASVLFVLSTWVTLPLFVEMIMAFSIGASAMTAIIFGYYELKK